MSECGGFSLFLEYFVANRTMFTFGFTFFGTSSRYGRIDYFGMTECGDFGLFLEYFVANRTMFTFG